MAGGGVAPPLDTAGGGHSYHWQAGTTVTTGRPACKHQLLDWQLPLGCQGATVTRELEATTVTTGMEATTVTTRMQMTTRLSPEA